MDVNDCPPEFAHLLYQAGYLFVPSGAQASQEVRRIFETFSWSGAPFGGGELFTHPACVIHRATNEAADIVFLGSAVDPFAEIADERTIVNGLLTAAEPLARSPANDRSLLEAVDRLTGRFVVFVAAGNALWAMTDPCALKAVYFSEFHGQTAISSHASLLAKLIGSPLCERTQEHLREFFRYSTTPNLPGNLSTYADIFLLTPNQLLDLKTAAMRRVFPREAASPASSQTLLEETLPRLQASARLLLNKSKCVLSLTAGVDSRTTLSVFLSQSNDVSCFTYINFIGRELGLDMTDALVARRICRRAGAPHQIYFPTVGRWSKTFRAFLRVWRENTAYARPERSALVPYRVFRSFPRGGVHVKSNAAEIFRAYYHKWSQPNCELENFTRLYAKHIRNKFIDEAFSRWFEQARFNEAALMSYDPRDMYYWEYRMGAWQGGACLNWEMSHDTWMLFNNRALLKRLLDAPVEERRASSVSLGVIDALAPALMEFPFTPKKRWLIDAGRKWSRLPFSKWFYGFR